jgi:hypothetical protein
VLPKAFEGRNALLLKEKLKRKVLALASELHPQAALLDEISAFGHFVFSQQHRARRHLLAGKARLLIARLVDNAL